MKIQELNQLRVKLESLKKVESSDEEIDAIRESVYEANNSDYAFEKGSEIGKMYGANSVVDTIISFLSGEPDNGIFALDVEIVPA